MQNDPFWASQVTGAAAAAAMPNGGSAFGAQGSMVTDRNCAV
jgi:hypothetical protein